MLKIVRTNSGDPDFIWLVNKLDKDLAIRDGEDHSFYDQFNKLTNIRHTVVLYVHDKPVGCGAIKRYAPREMEVKRMFVLPERRGEGLAGKILKELEIWALEMGYDKCILETGIKQPEAISLYQKSGYKKMSNYGQYEGVDNSLCFMKELWL